MTKEIQFTQSGSGWEHSFSSTGAVAVQVNAKSAGRILVYASLDGIVTVSGALQAMSESCL